jgi:hypothetical protein
MLNVPMHKHEKEVISNNERLYLHLYIQANNRHYPNSQEENMFRDIRVITAI